MAYNFSANQFEREFKAKRLGNWEVPKWYPDRPRDPCRGPTRIIVNEQGHLLPGIPRSNQSPWGNFKGTWDLPRKITRCVATKLSQEPRPEQLTAWERRCAHVPLPQNPPQIKYHPDQTKNVKPDPEAVTKQNGVHDRDREAHHGRTNGPMRARSSPHVPTTTPLEVTGHSASRSTSSSSKGSRSPRRHRHNGKDTPHPGVPYVPGELHHREYDRKPLVSPPTPPNVPGYRYVTTPPPKETRKQPRPPSGPPLADAYSNFVVAKQFHQGNLQHQPLPDTVQDAMYRKLQSQGAKYPGLALDNQPQTTAVGWRGYGAPGPTQCSKLRVHRPKTAGVIPDIEGPDPPEPGRPSTSVKRTKLRRQSRVGNMELAICWDLRPADKEDEPKIAAHIDGTNESAGPAVFTVVHQVEQPDCLKDDGGAASRPQPPPRPRSHRREPASVDSFNSLTPETAAKQRSRPRTAWSKEPHVLKEQLEKISSKGNDQENASPNARIPSASHRSGSVDRSIDKISSIHSSGHAHHQPSHAHHPSSAQLSRPQHTHHRSSPNLLADLEINNNKYHDHRSPNLPLVKSKLLNTRPCVACELKSPPPDPMKLLRRPKSEYKMAFKAGKPTNSFDSGSGPSTRPTTGKPVKMPKPRQFTKRSYSIDTLAPPFSLWPGNNASNRDYPEHWRLASVYQHAYKPVEARKKPLLASVYQ